jgi:hypothetical protein
MQYKYTARCTEYGLEYMPRVTVVVKNPKTGTELPVFGLVDSGATPNIPHIGKAKKVNTHHSVDGA